MSRNSQAAYCNVSPDRLRDSFAKLGNWATGFDINGHKYGGNYMAVTDPRVKLMLDHFPQAESALELGCLEGGHTLAMICGGITKVTAVEARSSSVERANYIRSIFHNQDKITIVPADIEKAELSALGKFDVIFCCGVLYHMANPRRLLEQMSMACSMGAYVWTHYHARASTWVNECGMDDPLSGTSQKSLWLSKQTLDRMLVEVGFKVAFQEIQKNDHGPAASMILEK